MIFQMSHPTHIYIRIIRLRFDICIITQQCGTYCRGGVNNVWRCSLNIDYNSQKVERIVCVTSKH